PRRADRRDLPEGAGAETRSARPGPAGGGGTAGEPAEVTGRGAGPQSVGTVHCPEPPTGLRAFPTRSRSMRPWPAFLCISVLSLGVASSPGAADVNQAKGGGKVQKLPFGKTADGQPVDLFVLTNSTGMMAKIMSYGCTITELHVPDRRGQTADVMLGFDNLK